MNIQERNELREIIQQIKKFDFSKEVANFYQSKEDLRAISIGKYPIYKFIFFFNTAITQLENELDTDNFYFYPIQPHAQPIAGINLKNTLSTFLNLLKKNQIPDIEPPLNQLITYEYYFGFWLITRYHRQSVKSKDLQNKKEKLDLLTQRVNTLSEKLNSQMVELTKSKQEFTDYIESRKKDIDIISQNLNNSTKNTQKISELLANSKKAEQQLANIIENQNKKFSEMDAYYNDLQNEFNSSQTEIEELLKTMKEASVKTEKNLTEANEGIKFIQEKKDDIIRLTGMAADGALGTKFNDRENRLQFGLKFWRWAVPIMTVIAIIWVIIVFTILQPRFDNMYVVLGINLIKTIPAFFLMGFVFNQYVKERNLQEEYAFKAAVAMTITAYSDLLAGWDEQKNTSRQQMILNAIHEVHKSPKIQSEKLMKSTGFDKNYLKETIKQLRELIREIKS